MLEKLKERVYKILEPHPGDRLSRRLLDVFLVILILLNVAAVMLETVHELWASYHAVFRAFEIFSVVVFTVEYILRVSCCTVEIRYRSSIMGRLRYMATPMAMIDLLAVLPFYLAIMFGLDLRVMRIIRLVRLFRMLKLVRYSKALRTLANVLKSKKEELAVTLFAAAVLLVFASSLMYYIERENQPEVFSSIPATLWWGIVTLTTVGYGDMHPSTPMGKVLGGVIALLGVGIVALPAGILAGGFAEELRSHGFKPGMCPHCGKNIHEWPNKHELGHK
jgi:voltage-gated potassium channel